MYVPGIINERTSEEKRDPFIAWARPDKAFFAAGACHILGHLFAWLHRDEGYELIHIKPKDEKHSGNHMYASNGTWAFDFNGWTLEEELLREYTKAYQHKHPGWDYDRIVVKELLFTYAVKNKHMPPEYFPHLPWERAYNYIKRFPAEPPRNSEVT